MKLEIIEKITHDNIVFNPNSTMTYTVTRRAVFLPERNHLDLNETLIAPNLAVLGMASYLHSSPTFIKMGFRFLAQSHGSTMFLKRTIYQYIWDYKEPVLDTSRTFIPGMVPVNNMGMLSRIYASFVENVTVYIGPKWGNEKFFTIVNVGGKPQLPGFNADLCPDRLYGSSEGVLYPQYLKKSDVLLYWRKSVCKLMPLYFDDHINHYESNIDNQLRDLKRLILAASQKSAKSDEEIAKALSDVHHDLDEADKEQRVILMPPTKAPMESYQLVAALSVAVCVALIFGGILGKMG